MNQNKIRILIFSHCPPSPTWGGAMTFHRHFIQSGDFNVLIAYTSLASIQSQPYFGNPFCESYQAFLPRIWLRLLNTRFHGLLVGLQELFGGIFLKTSLIKRARNFQPDIIFTVAGSWDWTPLAAQRLARIIGVPLVASFNDWYDYGSFSAWPMFRPLIRARFFRLFQTCDLALCTSPSMLAELGGGKHAHVLYPTGAEIQQLGCKYLPSQPTSSSPLKILFGGSLGDWYGPMLERLITCNLHFSNSFLEFLIFGANPTWSEQFHDFVLKNGIYKGLIPFEQLADYASSSDVLLLLMGFEESVRIIESTSFKTKFLDYLSFGRPILVWGPRYCTAVAAAQKYDSAEIVTDSSPIACLEALSRLGSDLQRRTQLITNASNMLQGDFHPSTIHKQLLARLYNLVESGNSSLKHSTSYQPHDSN